MVVKSNVVNIPFGKGLYKLKLNKEFDILRRSEEAFIADIEVELLKQLEDPISQKPLRDLLKGKKNIIIVVSDATRSIPNKEILDVLIPYLKKYGFNEKNIIFLIACGTHVKPTNEEIDKILGKDIRNKFKVLCNDCYEEEDFKSIGYIENGVEVKINKNYVDADFKILIGMLNPHPYAGYSGGRKSIVPGLCNYDSIKLVHGVYVMGHKNTFTDSIEHNPFHRIATAVLKKVGCDFIINATCSIDHRITRFFCGDAQDAFYAGVTFMRNNYKLKISIKYDVSITNGGGYPLDHSFYQLIKGMYSPVPYTKETGEIICLAKCDCENGFGKEAFSNLIKSVVDLDEWRKSLDNSEYVDEQYTLQAYQRLFKKFSVKLYSPLFKRAPFLHNIIEEISNIEEYLNDKLSKNPEMKIGVFLDGPNLF